ncbi:hypothetical protein AF332_26960 [Sporosarcina globispora]|uniref:Uncharacterized protein n=1 Tax=Sporosarcina globispora TaxID=1459 RepID=A0A0M0GJJ1_SPOGL|nr:hypothetical protein [Sporosarcina globispora]KON90085.1 hypothetical protein AF332_26960 [Sporosarcina globispora]
MDKNILEDGLTIISQCKSKTGGIWQAHIGAAAIAGYFFVRDNDLIKKLGPNVYKQSMAMIEENCPISRNQRYSGCNIENSSDAILGSLDKTIDHLHWVGHNVIYSAISLLAIHELNGWGTDDDLSGICDLILSFEKTIPGRSWIGFSASEVKRLAINEEDYLDKIENPSQLSYLVLEQLSEFPIIYRAESHHDLIGHMITFSHALNILHDLGHVSFFKRGLPPLLKLIKVLRSSLHATPGEPIKLISPVDHLPLQKAEPSEFLPAAYNFWTKDYSRSNWDFGHIFKFSFSFYDHLRRVERVSDAYFENFRYVISQ